MFPTTSPSSQRNPTIRAALGVCNASSARALVAGIAVAAALAGCGGGGSSGDGATGGGIFMPPPVALDLVTSVPTPTYAAGSNELAAFQRLNAQRAKCGFGLLAQNAKIDQAANAHRAYLVANQVIGHDETKGLPQFTGATVLDRLTAAGYSSAGLGEVVWGGYYSAPDQLPSGAYDAEVMLDLPYHSGPVLSMARDVGMAWGAGAFVLDTAAAAGTSFQSSPDVRTYPCDGTTEVQPMMPGENPSPFPSEAGAVWGPTVSVFGVALKIKNASITGPAGTVAIKAIYSDGGTVDPNARCDASHACIIPVPLQAGTKYSVHVEGTQAGTAFSKDFAFTTAAQALFH